MEKVRIQDDLYEYVNGETLEKLVIPDDRPVAGGFSQLDEDVEKIMMKEFDDFANGKNTTDIKEVKEAVKLYQKVLNVDRRNKEGITPVLPLLEKIKGMKNVKDLNALAKEFLFSGVALPFNMDVSDDMNDATKHALVILGPSIILPDTSYYDEANPVYCQLIGLYSAMASQVLAYAPLTKEEQELFLKDTLEIDKLISKAVKSRVEWANYVDCNNPIKLDEACEYLKPFDFKGLLKDLYGDRLPEEVVAYDLRAIKEFKTYFNDELFPKYVHWCYVKSLLTATETLSVELKSLGGMFGRALMGVASDPKIEKQAYQVASSAFSEPVGVYYGRKYFGEEAKADVVNLVKKIIETYKLRVSKNAFLKEATKEKAIKKLSTIEIKMGYPDKVNKIYALMKVNEEDSYYEAMLKLAKIRVEDSFNDLFKPVDRTKWLMPGHMVNACYNPSANDITFPAAILQKPFYSINQTVSENLGGIGAVIGHEISHAFDNNGAHFDENGNMKNWWTEEDFKAFDALTKDMIVQYDGIEFHGGKVNGELVVSENTSLITVEWALLLKLCTV